MFYGRIAVRLLYILVGGLVGHGSLGPEPVDDGTDISLVVAFVVLVVAICADVVIPTYERWLRREERRSRVKEEELQAFFEKRKQASETALTSEKG